MKIKYQQTSPKRYAWRHTEFNVSGHVYLSDPEKTKEKWTAVAYVDPGFHPDMKAFGPDRETTIMRAIERATSPDFDTALMRIVERKTI